MRFYVVWPVNNERLDEEAYVTLCCYIYVFVLSPTLIMLSVFSELKTA